MNIDTAKLRQFINEYFGPEDLRTFLFDYFRPVYDDLTDGLTKKRQIALLLEYCHSHKKFPDLLAAIERERSFFQPDDYVQGEKAPTAVPQPPVTITRNPRQIFISHAHQDAEVAQRLAHDLEAHGYDIWIAPDSIRPGEKWVEAINRGLEESSIFVLLLSPDAVASRWVQMETNAAIEFEHEGEVQFYPLMLKACRLPALWRTLHYISLQNGYEHGYAQLANLLKPETMVPPPDVRTILRDVATAKVVKDAASRRQEQKSFVDAKTGKLFVWVPAGEFLYGDGKKKVHLDDFWIAKTPVTNAEYARFVAETKVKPPEHWNGHSPPAELADHPVVYVSWHDAKAYAKWAGLELPSEEQWEKAARGVDGRKFPWGDEWREKYCNTSELRENSTTPVGQFSPFGDSPLGCLDMSGNVWEWTNSQYRKSKVNYVQRGGSWFNYQYFARTWSLYYYKSDLRDVDLGFRVVLP